MSNIEESKWLPIETSPKYPLDEYQNGPHFLGLCEDWVVREVWWSFPQPGSGAYQDNLPPNIEYFEGGRTNKVKPYYWFPMPEKPKMNG